jgi:uncharacterized protein YciI
MLYAILIFDESNSNALRDEYRQRHLQYLNQFDNQTKFAGPFTTNDRSEDLGSFRLMEFAGFEAARKHVEDEPYVMGGVQKHWQIHRWDAALPYTWRDCPRKNENIQVLFHALDKPDSGELRKKTTAANLSYLEENRKIVMSRGPLLADQGQIQIGSVFLLDVEGMDAAHEFKDNMPFSKCGLYKDITFHRWRFGRVFDRFNE